MDVGLERTIVTIGIAGMLAALMYLSGFRTDIVTPSFTVMGGIVAYWFRLNGQAPGRRADTATLVGTGGR